MRPFLLHAIKSQYFILAPVQFAKKTSDLTMRGTTEDACATSHVGRPDAVKTTYDSLKIETPLLFMQFSGQACTELIPKSETTSRMNA